MSETWLGKDPDVSALMERFPPLDGVVRILWHAGYWDGPLSGYCSVAGETGYWVGCIADHWNMRADAADDSCTGADGDEGCDEYPGDGRCCMKTWDRVYLVYKLDEDQERIHLANHELFRRHVGTHADYDANGQRGGKDHNEPGSTEAISLGLGVKPRDGWKGYYEADKPEAPPLREDQVVGHTLSLWPKGVTGE